MTNPTDQKTHIRPTAQKVLDSINEGLKSGRITQEEYDEYYDGLFPTPESEYKLNNKIHIALYGTPLKKDF